MSTIGRTVPFTQSLLLAAYQETARELLDELARAGHPRIRHKHGAVFANLDPAGTRPSVLAARAGMSKPAMGELVAELERLGYVSRRPDPDDGRATIVVPTAAALDVITCVRRVNRAIERRYRRLLGEKTYGAFRAALLAIVPPDRALVQPRITNRRAGSGRG
ncbi:MAG TPA: MarR family transcriptional regulator [Candidatus Binatia bacterium]|nr:MarR family transcriptional regulator [Candidatus Binatia bacterium]